MPAELIGIRIDDGAGVLFNEQDRTISREYTDVWSIRADTAEEAVEFAGLPRIGSGHTANPLARLVARDARFVGYQVYDIDCRYTTLTSADSEEDEEPWDVEPDWWWDSEPMDDLLVEDPVTGEPIVNSAGDRLFLTWPKPIPTLHIERYEMTFDGQTILDYVSKLNSVTFWGAPQANALMWAIRPKRESIQGTRIWKVHYEIKFKIATYGWLLRPLDQGPNYLSGAIKLRAIDNLGNPVVVNLDGAGAKAAVGTNTFLTFNPAEQVDFNTLLLGPF